MLWLLGHQCQWQTPSHAYITAFSNPTTGFLGRKAFRKRKLIFQPSKSHGAPDPKSPPFFGWNFKAQIHPKIHPKIIHSHTSWKVFWGDIFWSGPVIPNTSGPLALDNLPSHCPVVDWPEALGRRTKKKFSLEVQWEVYDTSQCTWMSQEVRINV